MRLFGDETVAALSGDPKMAGKTALIKASDFRLGRIVKANLSFQLSSSSTPSSSGVAPAGTLHGLQPKGTPAEVAARYSSLSQGDVRFDVHAHPGDIAATPAVK